MRMWYPLLLSLAALGGCKNSEPNVPVSLPPGTLGKGETVALKPPVLPRLECQTDELGIHRKVLITDRGVRALDQAPAGRPTGEALKFFFPYFVFDTHPSQGPPLFYRVGDTPQAESVKGWVPATVAVPWPTRVGGGYVAGFPLLVYRDRQAVEEWIDTGSTWAKPVARAAPSGNRAWMPWPIAESHLFRAKNGRSYEIVRLLFLGEFKENADLAGPAASPAGGVQPVTYTPTELQTIKSGIRKLDLVFVVDNTASTFPFLKAIVSAVEHIASQLQTLPFRPDISFSLVLYRDYVPDLMFKDGPTPSPVKVFPFQNDLGAFLETVKPLQTPSVSSEDWPEAVYDGVQAGLNVTWRDGLSDRVLVLIGDNSAHEPGHAKNPQGVSASQLLRLAQAQRARVYGLCINGGGGEEEQRRHREQWETLAKGTGGASYAIDEAGRVVEQISQILRQRAWEQKVRYEVVEELSKGKTADQLVASKVLDARQLTEVMVFLEGAGVDVKRLGANVPSFSTGWCCTEVGGRPVLEKKVLLARDELRLLLRELENLVSVLDPKIAERAHRLAVLNRIDPRSFFKQEGEETLDLFLMKQGVPCHHGVLKLTREEIFNMPEARQVELRDRLEKIYIPQLGNVRNDDKVWMWLNNLQFGWVKESFLP